MALEIGDIYRACSACSAVRVPGRHRGRGRCVVSVIEENHNGEAYVSPVKTDIPTGRSPVLTMVVRLIEYGEADLTQL